MNSQNFLKAVTILFASLLVSCAQPKYLSSAATPSGQKTQNQAEADCSIQFQPSKLCIAWWWETKPTSEQEGSLIFKVYRASSFDKTPIAVDTTFIPAVTLWMPSMGHGSSPTTVNKLDTGTYRASSVFFVMPGQWEIRFQVKDGNNIQDEAVVSLAI